MRAWEGRAGGVEGGSREPRVMGRSQETVERGYEVWSRPRGGRSDSAHVSSSPDKLRSRTASLPPSRRPHASHLSSRRYPAAPGHSPTPPLAAPVADRAVGIEGSEREGEKECFLTPSLALPDRRPPCPLASPPPNATQTQHTRKTHANKQHRHPQTNTTKTHVH